MKNNAEVNKFVLEGLCLKCFYLDFRVSDESFQCVKYNIGLDGIVDSCPAYMVISEGLDQLITRMKANGELPGWLEKEEKQF